MSRHNFNSPSFLKKSILIAAAIWSAALATGCGKSKSSSAGSPPPQDPTVEVTQTSQLALPGYNDANNVELLQLNGLAFLLKSIQVYATNTSQPDQFYFSYNAEQPGVVNLNAAQSKYDKKNQQNSYYEYSLSTFVPRSIRFTPYGVISDGEQLTLSASSNGTVNQNFGGFYWGGFTNTVFTSYTNILYPFYRVGIGSYFGRQLVWGMSALTQTLVLQKNGYDLVLNFQVTQRDQTWNYKMVLVPTAQPL